MNRIFFLCKGIILFKYLVTNSYFFFILLFIDFYSDKLCTVLIGFTWTVPLKLKFYLLLRLGKYIYAMAPPPEGDGSVGLPAQTQLVGLPTKTQRCHHHHSGATGSLTHATATHRRLAICAVAAIARTLTRTKSAFWLRFHTPWRTQRRNHLSLMPHQPPSITWLRLRHAGCLKPP